MKPRCLFIAALTGALLDSALPTVAAETNHWSFDVVPYLWVAGVDVQTSLQNPSSLPPSTSPDVARFDTRISAGALLAAQARYRSLGLFVDFAWLRLNSEALHPGPAFSDVNLKSDFIHTTAALTYRLPLQGKFHAEVLAGARLWTISEEISATGGVLPGFASSGTRTWADPVVGANLSYDLSKRWFLAARGTVGGFGVASEITWEAFGGVGYRMTDWCSATVGYRYLHEDYGRDRFTFNTDIQGVVLGVGFHF